MSGQQQSRLELLIGPRFAVEAAQLESGDPARWVGHYDLDVLRAPIDFLVDRQNTTSDLPDEPILPFCRALAAAVVDLAEGRRATVEFSEAPVELVFEPWDGARIALSIIEFGRVVRFRAHRILLPARDVASLVRSALEAAHATAAKRSETVATALDHVRTAVPALPYTGPATRSLLGVISVETRSDTGAAIETMLRPDTTGLGAEDVDGPLGRYALLAHGTLTIDATRGRGLVLRGSPLRLLDTLVDALGPGFSPDEIANAELCHTDEGSLTGAFRDGRASLDHPSGKPMRMGTDEFFRLVSEHASAVVDALRRANPALKSHPDLCELDETARTLRANVPTSFSLTGPMPAIVVPRPTKESSIANPAGWAFPSSAIRRMRYERGWTLVREGLLPRTVAHRPDDGLLFCWNSALELIDVVEGTTIAEADVPRGVRLREDRNELVVFADSGVSWLQAATLERRRSEEWVLGGSVRAVAAERGAAFAALDDGRLLATNGRGIGWSAMAPGPAPLGLACADDVVVVARPGAVEGRSRDDGQLMWSVKVRFERVSVRVIAGLVAVVADAPLKRSTLIGIIDPHTGRWTRRTRFAADIRTVGWRPGQGVAVLLDDGASIRAAALDVAAGTDWSAPTGFARGQGVAKARLDRDGVVATFGRVISRIGPDGIAWQQQPEAARTGSLLMARRNLSDGLVVVAGESELLVIETSEGRVLHRVPAFWEQLATLIADARGHIVVVESPDDGETRIHGVSAVGVIAALDGGLALAN